MNTPGDGYEQEADRAADRVMRMGDAQPKQPASMGVRRPAAAAATEIGEAPGHVRKALSVNGEPLESSTCQFMEARFGQDFSLVRVHRGEQAAASARALGASAYTIGERIVIGSGEPPNGVSNRKLLAHELAHVVQQRGGGPQAPAGQLSPSDVRVARQPVQARTTPGELIGKPVVLGSQASDLKRKTQVTIHVTAHASPRWRGARSDDMADANNLALSQRRENAVTERVKQLLREALPDQQLDFQAPRSTGMDARFLDDKATVGVDSSAIGSNQTLQEAGPRGRRANDPSMLRVDLSISLFDATDTIHDTKIKERRQLSGATQEWAMKMGVGLEAEAGFGVGGLNFMLKNRKTKQEVEGGAGFGVAGIGASLPIPTIDTGGYQNFRTRRPANFSDFDGARFHILSSGFNALLFGYEFAEMTIFDLPGGAVEIDVGGFVMGGAGLNIVSEKGGKIYLRQARDTYNADVVRDERQIFTSRMTDKKRHHVLFKTGDATISSGQEKRLQGFVNSAVENYQRGGL